MSNEKHLSVFVISSDVGRLIRASAYNPLSSKSDQHKQYQYPINRKGYENKMITAKKNILTFYEIVSTVSWRKCMEIKLENFYVNIRSQLAWLCELSQAPAH